MSKKSVTDIIRSGSESERALLADRLDAESHIGRRAAHFTGIVILAYFLLSICASILFYLQMDPSPHDKIPLFAVAAFAGVLWPMIAFAKGAVSIFITTIAFAITCCCIWIITSRGKFHATRSHR